MIFKVYAAVCRLGVFDPVKERITMVRAPIGESGSGSIWLGSLQAHLPDPYAALKNFDHIVGTRFYGESCIYGWKKVGLKIPPALDDRM